MGPLGGVPRLRPLTTSAETGDVSIALSRDDARRDSEEATGRAARAAPSVRSGQTSPLRWASAMASTWLWTPSFR